MKKTIIFIVITIFVLGSIAWIIRPDSQNNSSISSDANRALFIVNKIYDACAATASWSLSKEDPLFPFIVIIAALIDSVNPCAFGILLLTIAFLFSLGKTRFQILKIGSVYILGIFFVYVLIGLGILQVFNIFNIPRFMAKVGAFLLIILGTINIINEFFPSFPIKLRIPKSAHNKIAKLMEKASIPAVFLLGILVGFCEFPCTGGPYLMVLGLLHDQGTYFAGIGYLFLYNMVFILPLVAILLIASNSILVEKIKKWKKTETKNMRIWGGIAMIIFGLFIFLLQL